MMFDWHVVVSSLGGLLATLAILPYVYDIFRGTTRPNIVSYGLWALLLIISMAAQISSGASWPLVFLIGDLIGTSTIVLLCLIGYGYANYGWVEVSCVVFAFIAIVSWQITSQPLLAIIFAIVADMIAAVPTVVKSFRDPMSELPITWFIIAAGAFLGIVSTELWNPANLLFPISLLFTNLVLGISSAIGRQRASKNVSGVHAPL